MNLSTQMTNRAWGALAALAAIILVAATSAFAGLSVLQSEWTELDARQTELANLTHRPRQTAAPVKEKAITINPFLSEDNFALSANALQKRVVGLIESSGGKLVTVNVDPPVTGDVDLARRVSVQVSAEMTNDALQKVLYELESQPPFAFIETMTATLVENRDAAGKVDPQAVARLNVNLNVIGYRRKASR